MFTHYTGSFIGMVLPGDKLSVKIQHISMRDGHVVVKVTTSNTHGEKVWEGTAEVAQPMTVCIFTGQGSQEPGMGMDLYSNSLVACVTPPYSTSMVFQSLKSS